MIKRKEEKIMENIEGRLTIMRAVHPRNGRAREAGISVNRTLSTNGDLVTVQQIHIHSSGREVTSAVVVSDYQSELSRQGNPAEVIRLLEGMAMQPISLADLRRSRGAAEGEVRRLLAQP